MAVKNEELPPIQFVAGGETPEQQENNLELVLPSPGFPKVSILIADAIQKRSELTLLDFTQNQTNIRCQIDGIWHSMPPMDRETSDYMLAALKQLAGMNYRERRLRQEGRFRADYLRRKTGCRIISQGVRTGERVAIYLDIPRPPLETLEDLGMRANMKNQLASLLEESQSGMTLVCAMPNEGYTSLWRGVLTAADRFTRDYYVMEEASRVEPDVVNVASMTYDESAGETAFTRMPQLLLREPNFIAFTEIPNGKILDQICNLSIQEELPVLARIHGKNALDGLLRLMLLKSDQQKLVDTLQSVVAMRIVRKLCQECRVGFRPNPMLLQKLGIPQGRINLLYKPFVFQPEMVDEDGNAIEMCSNCHGIGYYERTGIFELLRIGDPIRKLLRSSPNLNQLAAEVRKHNHVSMREEGVVLVAKGQTSLEELQRILKA
jgi:type II secretory ATPase GspE/PulE/Tfp pilus assembly ATPase PilB-like protein